MMKGALSQLAPYISHALLTERSRAHTAPEGAQKVMVLQQSCRSVAPLKIVAGRKHLDTGARSVRLRH